MSNGFSLPCRNRCGLGCGSGREIVPHFCYAGVIGSWFTADMEAHNFTYADIYQTDVCLCVT